MYGSVCVLDVVDIPFELVGEVSSAGAVAEAGHVEGSAAARHDERSRTNVLRGTSGVCDVLSPVRGRGGLEMVMMDERRFHLRAVSRSRR